MSEHFARVQGGGILDADQASAAFETIMSGGVTESDLAAFLRAMSERGPKVPEILGAARVMRAKMTAIAAPPGAVDLCGTGGDGQGTLNISTAVSFVVAACGVPVAKHGNRNMSSRTGAADVLEALGARIALSPEASARCLADTGLCFLFAQAYHPAMRHVANVRKQLGMRTIFNLLGPLSNPARVRRQLLGVYAKEWVRPVAEVLRELGAETAWVVHGSDGLDEITTTGPTHVAVLADGVITEREVTPEDAGIARSQPGALKGGAAEENADALRRLLQGEPGAYRDIVLINSAAVLIVAGKIANLRDGAALAAEAIDDGRALQTLERFVTATAA
ncbi:MAG TPA: anthranilate phosphoribosyltransferase [Rhizomicrobium sp.]|jgi:anthranilate phosphoribosyltransferase